VSPKKKLIEVALPLEAINKESLRRKQKAPKGWPTSFHKWWAQRPLAAARAVIFAQMVDDPSSNPDLFPTERKQEKERQRLFQIIENLVQWDNTHNQRVLEAARDEIWQSWRRACAQFADHPGAKTLFDRNKLPAFCDPFAGSGSIPLSAQWLGLDSYASDLNPVAVIINKALMEIPHRFAGRRPVNPKSRADAASAGSWRGATGLADDVRYYGQWMREQAERRIGKLFPKVEVTAEMVKGRPDLKPYVGQQLTVIAWLWARTVKSPNPAFSMVDVPLASTFVLSSKEGREAYVEPVVEGGGYRFTVKMGKPKDANSAKNGTKLARANFTCLMSGTPIAGDYIKAEGKAGRMGARLMAIVAEGDRGRVYLAPTLQQEAAAQTAHPEWKPEGEIPKRMTGGNCTPYGLTTWGDLFTPRQLVALTTFSDLVTEARDQVQQDAFAAGFSDDRKPLRDGGAGGTAYAEAICTYLACTLDRMVYYGSSLTTWLPKDNALRDCMPRQGLAMVWDFAEGNPFGKSSGDVMTCSSSVSNYLDVATPFAAAFTTQADAQGAASGGQSFFLFSTDPPYYDNIGYADLSDFFYVWLRRSLRPIFPDLFETLAVPKAEELVATPYRHGSKEQAETFFLDGMTKAMHRLAEQAHPAFPVSIYYAFKQSETDDAEGTTNTGWDTFLDAVLRAGFAVSGTWPLRTEGAGRMIASGTNALASSIVLVCRPRPVEAPIATRREFVAALKRELPDALRHLQAGNIAPVDLAQAAIGPGMAIYTRYSKVLDAEGNPLSVREALALINQTLDEALAEQEGDFDADSRWALAWFEQQGFAEGEYGVAETLSKAKNTSVAGLAEARILESKRGRVRLFKPDELPEGWEPSADARLTHWETVHQLIRVLSTGGESAAGVLVSKLGAKAETARELAYRLYTVCERKKRAAEALAYNGLVQSWPEIARLAREGGKPKAAQGGLFAESEE
jgi:putative DNA methylase